MLFLILVAGGLFRDAFGKAFLLFRRLDGFLFGFGLVLGLLLLLYTSLDLLYLLLDIPNVSRRGSYLLLDNFIDLVQLSKFLL